MTPADAAAFAALNLRPGASWPEVTDAWRHLVKLYHPDRNPLLGTHEWRRLLEVNAAYEHLKGCARQAPPDGRLVVRRETAMARDELWERVWQLPRWAEWVPGVHHASTTLGMSDRRGSADGRWDGHRWWASVVFCGVTPCRRLAARVLELRIDGRLVDLFPAPRVWVRLDDGAAEIGVTLPPTTPVEVFEGLELLLVDALERLLGDSSFEQAA